MITRLTIAALLLAAPAAASERRSAATRHAFQLTHPCPATGATHGRCPGYIRDHVVPLACGGADLPANMQWQTVSDAQAKDRWERAGCRKAPRAPG